MTDKLSGTTTRRSPALWLSCLALAIAGGTLLWQWQEMRALQSRAEPGGQIDAQLADIARRENALVGADRHLEDQLATLMADHAGVTRRVDTLYATRRAGLLAADAEHLTRLAAQRLALMQDAAGALALLNAADAVVRDIPGADVHAARAALARDSALLKDAAAFDAEAVWLRLAMLPERIDELVAASVTPQPEQDTATASGQTSAPIPEQSGWERFRHTLLSLVSIRRVDATLTPAVTRGEREIAARSFRLLIEQAQLALLQRRAGVYRQSLAQAGHWLDRIAMVDPARLTRARQELASLQIVDIGKPLPDLTASLATTRALALQLLPETAAEPAR